MKRRLIKIAIWMVAIPTVLIGLVLLRARLTAPPPDVLVISAPLTVSLSADEIMAGETLMASVETTAAPGTPISFSFLGSYGSTRIDTVTTAGTTTIEVPSQYTTRRGTLTVYGRIGVSSHSADAEIHPREPVDSIVPIIGQRSIVADGSDWAMAVAVVEDTYGNAVAEGTPVLFSNLHPDQSVGAYNENVTYALVWTRVTASTTAGRGWVNVTSGDATGPARQLEEVPDQPVEVTLSTPLPEPVADGSALLSITTNTMVDVNGNQLLDGTYVEFHALEPDGQIRFFSSQTIDGSAQTLIQVPELPGTLTIWAIAYGVRSDDLVLEFAQSLSDSPIDVSVTSEEGVLTVTAGPIRGVREELIFDGTEVTVTVAGSVGSATGSAPTDGGVAELPLRLAEIGAGPWIVTIEVNGRVFTLDGVQ